MRIDIIGTGDSMSVEGVTKVRWLAMVALHKLYGVFQVDSTGPACEQGSQPPGWTE